MKRILALTTAVAISLLSQQGNAGVVGQQSLDAAVVTTPELTGGTIIAAAGTVFGGCWVQNDPAGTGNLVVDALHAANASTPSSTAAILAPGQVYYCPGGIAGTSLTADATDSGHKIYGAKW